MCETLAMNIEEWAGAWHVLHREQGDICCSCMQDEGSEVEVKLDGKPLAKGEETLLGVGMTISYGSSEYKVIPSMSVISQCRTLQLRHAFLMLLRPKACWGAPKSLAYESFSWYIV